MTVNIIYLKTYPIELLHIRENTIEKLNNSNDFVCSQHFIHFYQKNRKRTRVTGYTENEILMRIQFLTYIRSKFSQNCIFFK